ARPLLQGHPPRARAGRRDRRSHAAGRAGAQPDADGAWARVRAGRPDVDRARARADAPAGDQGRGRRRAVTADSLELTLSVNGAEHAMRVDPRRTLADVLREDLGLTGTHVGCEHGVCGACTVLVDGATARSCLLLAAQCEGAAVTTIEGLTPAAGLSPLQEAFRACHGLQCGFCTPGMIVV